MDQAILSKIYANPIYLDYLRYHPKWYIILNKNLDAYTLFENELKKELKLTLSDKIEQLRKQIDFINGMIKYMNSN